MRGRLSPGNGAAPVTPMQTSNVPQQGRDAARLIATACTRDRAELQPTA